jgi:hypothetical protein
MSSLPFIQPPQEREKRRCGTPATGVVEFEVYGGLTVAEAADINVLQASGDSSFTKGAQIAEAIAQAEDISLLEAFNLIQDAVMGKRLEPAADLLRVKHSEAIEQVAQIYAAAGERSMVATVTALIRHRLAQPSWTVEETKQLPRALFQAIWEFAESEIAAEGVEQAPPTEADLKKPQAENGKKRRTGNGSSGTSAVGSQGNGTAAPSAVNSASA